MTKYYVKVLKNQIVEGPKEVSCSESDSPNTHWSEEQMKLNDFYLVDLSHDPNTEKIDYSSPIISGDTVSYPRVFLGTEEKNNLYNAEQLKKREAEYPTTNEYVAALWAEMINGDPKLTEQVLLKIQTVDEKYPLK